MTILTSDKIKFVIVNNTDFKFTLLIKVYYVDASQKNQEDKNKKNKYKNNSSKST